MSNSIALTQNQEFVDNDVDAVDDEDEGCDLKILKVWCLNENNEDNVDNIACWQGYDGDNDDVDAVEEKGDGNRRHCMLTG